MSRFVYIVAADAPNVRHVKVGSAHRIESRMSEFNCPSPYLYRGSAWDLKGGWSGKPASFWEETLKTIYRPWRLHRNYGKRQSQAEVIDVWKCFQNLDKLIYEWRTDDEALAWIRESVYVMSDLIDVPAIDDYVRCLFEEAGFFNKRQASFMDYVELGITEVWRRTKEIPKLTPIQSMYYSLGRRRLTVMPWWDGAENAIGEDSDMFVVY